MAGPQQIQTSVIPPMQIPLHGAVFVGPHVFEEAQRIAEQRGDHQAASEYAKALKNADKHNLLRLRHSQRTPWVPPVLRPLSGPAPHVLEKPDEGQISDFQIYDAKNEYRPHWNPNDIVRKKGEALSGDASVDGVYQSIVDSLWFYLKGLGIHSINDRGLLIRAAVHIGEAYNNAYYSNGAIHFGDGDGEIFWKFAEDLSVVAHELGHGIVEMLLGGLTYWSQSGALNESLSDVIGISALQYALGQQTTAGAMWLVGQKSMVPYKDEQGQQIKPALRSLESPGTAYKDHPLIGTDPQPASMKNYYRGSSDNYGVHINSGIPNRAFYLAATEIGSWSKDTVLRVWMEATKSIGKDADFKDFADATLEKARELFGDRQEIYDAIEKAWEAVKVTGAGAVDIAPRAYRITHPDVIDIFGMNAKRLASLYIQTENYDLNQSPGVEKLTVGFELDKHNKAKLVLLAYVDKANPSLVVPQKLFGCRVVAMDESDAALQLAA